LTPSRATSNSLENRVKAGEKTKLTTRQEKHVAARTAAAAAAASTSRSVNWQTID